MTNPPNPSNPKWNSHCSFDTKTTKRNTINFCKKWRKSRSKPKESWIQKTIMRWGLNCQLGEQQNPSPNDPSFLLRRTSPPLVRKDSKELDDCLSILVTDKAYIWHKKVNMHQFVIISPQVSYYQKSTHITKVIPDFFGLRQSWVALLCSCVRREDWQAARFQAKTLIEYAGTRWKSNTLW